MPRARVFTQAMLLTFSFACGGDDDDGPRDEPSAEIEESEAIEIEGEVNGLWWSPQLRTLLLSNEDSASILGWNDDDGLHVVTALEAPDEGRSPELGALVQLPGGTIVVARKNEAAVVEITTIAPDGTVASIAGLDPTRLRIGLTADPGGALYVSWTEYIDGERHGSVSKIGLAGYDDLVAEGFDKPAAVLARAGALFIADQPADQILRVDLASGDLTPFVTDVKRPDVLAAGPDGSIFVAVVDPEDGTRSVLRVDRDGNQHLLVGGLDDVRGIAWDPDDARLFVAEPEALNLYTLVSAR